MRELLAALDAWRRAGRRIALARVVDLAGSGPRRPGAAMAVNEDGEVAGSVSGGCVEGAVVQACLQAFETGERSVISFGYSDDDAFAVGLTCGGTIHLFVAELQPDLVSDGLVYDGLAEGLRAGVAMALATVIEGPAVGSSLLLAEDASPLGSLGSLGDPELDRIVTRDALGELAVGASRIRHYGPQGQALRDDVSVFVESFVPPARMLIFGAVDFTAALCKVAKVLGFRVILCDARAVFATPTRFPHADEIVVDWPHRLLERVGQTLTARDAICVLTHEAKFDVPAIIAALGTEAGYIGAMGSRRTHTDRALRLRQAGVDDADLARLYSPIGLDLGALTPEDTAVSICAEIIAARRSDHKVRSLSEVDGPIHAR
jgi:xanthine dehydrogenase accessory factor